jgi:hypothetical protein
VTHAAARVFDREDICWYLLAYTSQFEFIVADDFYPIFFGKCCGG